MFVIRLRLTAILFPCCFQPDSSILAKHMALQNDGVAVAAWASQPPSYELVNLGIPDEDTNFVKAFAINDLDQVAGFFTIIADVPAFFWDQGVFTVLPKDCVGYPSTGVSAINARGNITGWDTDNGFGFGTWLWINATQSMQCLPGVYAWDVNDADEVVLQSTTDLESFAYIWRDGVLTPLPGLTEQGSAVAYALNNAGWAAGAATEFETTFPERPALWINGEVQEIVVAEPNIGVAVSINDAGQAVGYYEIGDPENDRAFFWQNGQSTDLGTLGDVRGRPGATRPIIINDAGDIISTRKYYDNPSTTLYLYHEGEWLDLNTLIDPEAGWILSRAYDINDAGRIVGWGKHDGKIRAFILIPRDEFRTTGAVPGVAGEFNGVIAHGATPAGRVVFLYALSRGATTVPKVCPGITIDLARPIYVIGSRRADANGDCTIQRYVPESAGGTTIFIQAVDIESCETSPVVAHHFPNA
jgi:probable HAF family extracellular repeat protein